MFLGFFKKRGGAWRDGRCAYRTPFKNRADPGAVEKSFGGDIRTPLSAGDGFEHVGSVLGLFCGYLDVWLEREVIVDVDAQESCGGRVGRDNFVAIEVENEVMRAGSFFGVFG